MALRGAGSSGLRGKKFFVDLSCQGADLAVMSLLGGLDSGQTAMVQFVPGSNRKRAGFYEVSLPEISVLDEFSCPCNEEYALILDATVVKAASAATTVGLTSATVAS